MILKTLTTLITSSAKVAVIIFGVLCFLNFLPKSAKFTAFEVKEPKSMVGPLFPNKHLNNAERLFEGKIKGPEGFAVLNGELYTSLHGGYIAKVKSDGLQKVVQFGEPCKEIQNLWWDEKKCGRPLGLDTTPDGHIIAADAYYGIWKFNPKSGATENLVPQHIVYNGRMPRIFNDVAVAKDGSIYWSHSSSDYDLCEGILAMLADPSGRLFKYDPVTKHSTVLLDNIYFANGVALSEDESFVVVAETGSSAVRRVYVKGPKKGQSDILIDGLPGMPDGIRRNGKRGFYVTLNVARDAGNIAVTDYIAPFPVARKVLSHLLTGTKLFFQQIHRLYPNDNLLKLVHTIGHFEMITPFLAQRATVVEIDENGKVIQSYHALDGSVTGLSDIIVHQGHVYLGSPYNTYLGRVKLSQMNMKPAESNKRP